MARLSMLSMDRVCGHAAQLPKQLFVGEAPIQAEWKDLQLIGCEQAGPNCHPVTSPQGARCSGRKRPQNPHWDAIGPG